MATNIKGLDKIINILDELGDSEKTRAALGKACAIVERAAKENAPKGTGELKRSITSTIEEIDGRLEGVVFTPLEYAPYIEYGTGLFAEDGGRQDVPWRYKDDEGNWHSTSGMKPHPYMRPALNENRIKIIDLFKEGVKID